MDYLPEFISEWTNEDILKDLVKAVEVAICAKRNEKKVF